jgi:hypothetical protein
LAREKLESAAAAASLMAQMQDGGTLAPLNMPLLSTQEDGAPDAFMASIANNVHLPAPISPMSLTQESCVNVSIYLTL